MPDTPGRPGTGYSLRANHPPDLTVWQELGSMATMKRLIGTALTGLALTAALTGCSTTHTHQPPAVNPTAVVAHAGMNAWGISAMDDLNALATAADTLATSTTDPSSGTYTTDAAALAAAITTLQTDVPPPPDGESARYLASALIAFTGAAQSALGGIDPVEVQTALAAGTGYFTQFTRAAIAATTA